MKTEIKLEGGVKRNTERARVNSRERGRMTEDLNGLRRFVEKAEQVMSQGPTPQGTWGRRTHCLTYKGTCHYLSDIREK